MGILFLNACTEALHILQEMNVREPKASISRVELKGLSLQKVDLLFDVSVENPNSMSVHLSNLNYNLFVNNNSFIKGSKTDPLEIKAHSKAKVNIPITLTFDEIRKMFSSIGNLDTIPYHLDLDIGADLPVLGTVQIPVSRKGSFPNFRIPKISMQGIKLKNLSFTEAKLNLNIQIENPNTFSFGTNNFMYALEVNGLQWMNGLLNQPVTLNAKSEQILQIPISLNLLNLGATAYQLFAGNAELNYHLTGQMKLNSSYDYLQSFNLPFDKTGNIKLTK